MVITVRAHCYPLDNIIHMYSGITSVRVLDGNLCVWILYIYKHRVPVVYRVAWNWMQVLGDNNTRLLQKRDTYYVEKLQDSSEMTKSVAYII